MSNTKYKNPFIVNLQSDEASDNSDKVISVPNDKVWQILNIHVEFNANSTVGDRQVEVQFRDSDDDIIFKTVAGNTQAADEDRVYEFYPNGPDETTFRDTDKLSNPIPDLALDENFDIRVFDNNAVDADADDMVVQILVNEFDK